MEAVRQQPESITKSLNHSIAKWFVAAAWMALIYLLFFHGLGDVGLLGPDEPRYAQVAREMLRTGDWVTPHLMGRPWFEKPPLYYWMAAASFRVLGVSEFAARLPGALAGAAFLALFGWIARQLFRGDTALYCTLVLASTLGWIGFSRAASPEILFTTALAGALGMLALWVWTGRAHLLYSFYALLAAAALAKGPAGIVLSALVLASYCVLTGEYRWLLRVLSPTPLLLFFLLALPWYIAVYVNNGSAFVDDFIIKHHFRRFTTAELAHPGPWWYYAPVIVGGTFPWSAHLWLIVADVARLRWTGLRRDPRRLFLVAWIVPVLLFFSASQAKLPGYVLVIAPALALWIGNELSRAPADRVRGVFFIQAALLPLLPLLAALLPGALGEGLRSAAAELTASGFDEVLATIALAGALLLALFAWRRRRLAATALTSIIIALAVARLISAIGPAADRAASARPVAREIHTRGLAQSQIALHPDARRHLQYGLEFYLDAPIPRTMQKRYVISPQGEILHRGDF